MGHPAGTAPGSGVVVGEMLAFAVRLQRWPDGDFLIVGAIGLACALTAGFLARGAALVAGFLGLGMLDNERLDTVVIPPLRVVTTLHTLSSTSAAAPAASVSPARISAATTDAEAAA
jgi:hypothetical protein